MMKSYFLVFLLLSSLSCAKRNTKINLGSGLSPIPPIATPGDNTPSTSINLSLASDEFDNGNQIIKVIAKDDNGNPIVNEEVKLDYGTSKHSAITDESGEASFVIPVGFDAQPKEIIISSSNQPADAPPVTSISKGAEFSPAEDFGTPQVLATNSYSQEVISADFNKDGKTDLVSGFYGNTINLFLGNGDGTFQPSRDTTLPEVIDALEAEVIDLDKDGNLDVIVPGTSHVIFLKGDGQGNLTYQNLNILHSDPSSAVRVTDIDQDGKLDIILGRKHTGVVIYYGQGDLKFSDPLILGTYPWIRSIDFGDLNGDKKLDIVATAFRRVEGGVHGGSEVLFSTGNRNFAPILKFEYGGITNFEEKGQYIRIADLNGDQRPDVITSTYFGRNFRILLNNGDNTFTEKTQYIDYTTVGFSLFDYDQDGHLDIVVNDLFTSYVHFLKNDGDANFTITKTLPTGAKPSWGITIGDLNHDKIPDVVTGHHQSNTISILLGN